MMKKGWQNILNIFIIYIGLFSFISQTTAKNLTITEVEKGYTFSGNINIGDNPTPAAFSAKANTTAKTIDVSQDSAKIYTISYTDNELSMDYPIDKTVLAAKTSTEIMTAETNKIIAINTSLIAILKAAGKDTSQFKNMASRVNISALPFNEYATSGFEITFDKVTLTATETELELIKSFKITFDTDKINALATKLEPKPEINVLDLTPTLKIDNITETSATLYPSITLPDGATAPEQLFCFIHRSTEENGTYERILEKTNCLSSLGITDTNLKPDTTYYYKTILAVDGATKYSAVSKIITKETAKPVEPKPATTTTPTSSKNGNDIENPQTGISLPFIGLITLLISGILILKNINKKVVFKRI